MKKIALKDLNLDKSNVLSINEKRNYLGGNTWGGYCGKLEEGWIVCPGEQPICVKHKSECKNTGGALPDPTGPCCYAPCSDPRNTGIPTNAPCPAD